MILYMLEDVKCQLKDPSVGRGYCLSFPWNDKELVFQYAECEQPSHTDMLDLLVCRNLPEHLRAIPFLNLPDLLNDSAEKISEYLRKEYKRFVTKTESGIEYWSSVPSVPTFSQGNYTVEKETPQDLEPITLDQFDEKARQILLGLTITLSHSPLRDYLYSNDEVRK